MLSATISCNNAAKKTDSKENSTKVESQSGTKSIVKHPDWSKSANIYEVNVRQYTKAGTFKEFEKHLPRLKEMGVDILWLMPIFEIGKKFRKATPTKLVEEIENPKEREKYLGSYYGIKNYLTVNPEFGTFDDFKELVNKIHELGMHVILDIAINHTSWDNVWIKSHPDFYTHIDKDSIPWNKKWMQEHPAYFKEIKKLGMTYPISPNETDWWDTADLNYDNKELRDEMKNIFKFWINKAGVDGYRCDVAGFVPTDFWEELRPVLDSIKPIFMLAEAEQPEHHNKAFDASYAWELHHIMNKIAKGEANAEAIDKYLTKQDSLFPKDAIRMAFITNHDENSWNGTVEERMGEAAKAMAVLSYTLPGMPLIYSGQEAGLNKRLLFFEKDEIDWNTNKSLGEFYKQLNKLKTNNSSLWNADKGAKVNRISTNHNKKVYAFVRKNTDNEVLVILNLSKDKLKCNLKTDEDFTGMKEYFTNEEYKSNEFDLKAWDYKIFVK